MRKALMVLGFLLVGSASVQAQDEESLTREFPELSARERSRIAKREAAEAPRDEAFQAVMRTADELFQAGRYQESLERYLEARRMRPYNVYPKVKAQDLQALLDRRAAEAAAPSDPPVPRAVPQVEPPREPSAPPMLPTVDPLPSPPPAAVVGMKPPDASRGSADPAPPTPAAPQDGLEERRYREGRADVLERRLTRNGQTTTYRRVRHPWGAVFHFKDGEAISGTAWEQAFSGVGD